MTNLEAFNLITAKVFASCYIAFPVSENFEISDFDLDVPQKQKETIVICTMLWLERYGWITIGKNTHSLNFCLVQLTEKALYVLNWMPEALKDGRSLGHRFGEALTTHAPASAIGALVGEAVKAFLSPGS